jgi:hypothetical protein
MQIPETELTVKRKQQEGLLELERAAIAEKQGRLF